VQWKLLGKPGEEDKAFTLDKTSAIKLYGEALGAAQHAKLPIHLEEIVLSPLPHLLTLVKKSMELAAIETGEGSTP
jgi:hypothetical protein